jgi:outer membrane protein OmpA-like peptidoglycan-associated protein
MLSSSRQRGRAFAVRCASRFGWGFVLSLMCGLALAQDMAGAKDHPAIKRFQGSSIVAYDVKQFDSVDIPTSRFVKFNLTTGKREFAGPPVVAEGRRTRIWYEAPGDTSSMEVFRNYAAELTAQGFTLLYDSTQDTKLGKWNGYLNGFGFNKAPLATNRSQFVFTGAAMSGINTLSAQRERQGQLTYVHLVAVQWDKPNVTFKAQRGAYVALDVVDVGSLKQNMVSVSASDMSKAIASSGRIALYGILFDTARAEIKVESKPALEEIAKLLQSDPSLKLRVVGHTDNQGSLDANIALSKRRAEAVTAALASSHGVAANRLSAFGVADLAPVASNSGEEGRTKNRRVELVPQ